MESSIGVHVKTNSSMSTTQTKGADNSLDPVLVQEIFHLGEKANLRPGSCSLLAAETTFRRCGRAKSTNAGNLANCPRRPAMRQTLLASCPGKVLAAGGYVVLEKPNTGLVVATSSRFYTTVSDTGVPVEPHTLKIRVESPQFLNAAWDYTLCFDNATDMWSVQTTESQGRNPFVQTALHTVVSFLSALHEDFLSINSTGCRVIVLGDNDFYTQASTNPPPFSPLHCTLSNVHKTGLGSSAAMTTSLVSALLHYLVPEAVQDQLNHGLLHNIAQFAHAAAQGKVGSGFDVSSAVYGTHQYSRFAPACLQDLLDCPLTEIPSKRLVKVLSPSHNSSWSDPAMAAEVHPLALPPLTTMLLADVDAGSNTPSMVSAVLKWRKANPDSAAPIWDEIVQLNKDLAEHFISLNKLWEANPEKYQQEMLALQMENLAGVNSQSDIRMALSKANACMQKIRKNIKAMGEAACVGIEPNEQTDLLDACCALPGIVGAGVPGAGGLDAIWVLAIDMPGHSKCVSAVEELWASWTATKVSALSASSRAQGPGAPHHSTAVSAKEGVQVELLREARGPIVEKLRDLDIEA